MDQEWNPGHLPATCLHLFPHTDKDSFSFSHTGDWTFSWHWLETSWHDFFLTEYPSSSIPHPRSSNPKESGKNAPWPLPFTFVCAFVCAIISLHWHACTAHTHGFPKRRTVTVNNLNRTLDRRTSIGIRSDRTHFNRSNPIWSPDPSPDYDQGDGNCHCSSHM